MAQNRGQTEQAIQFIESPEMAGRSFRMTRDDKLAYEQAAADNDPVDRNVSRIHRQIIEGDLPSLVDMGYLCLVCRQMGCKAHTLESAAGVIERARRRLAEAEARFGAVRTASSTNGTTQKKAARK